MDQTKKIATLLIVVLFCLTLTAGCMVNYQHVDVPHIVVETEKTPPVNISNTFLFEKNRITISIPVDAAVYHGAQSTDHYVTVYGNVSESVWQADSTLAMMNDPAQNQMFTDLLTQFRNLRDEQRLSTDEYLELMATYTQTLPYDSRPGSPAKYPVETVVDGKGDCADKSLLLAGLLSREGYKVAFLVFSPESHMALGVGSPDTVYKKSGYAYLETTNLSYVGIPPSRLAGDVILTSEPIVIPVGNGTIVYKSGAETSFINDTATQAKHNALLIDLQNKKKGADLTAKHNQIAELNSNMEALRRAGNIAAYNTQVSYHNALVSSYNAEVATYQQQVALAKAYADVYNYIITHEYDRKGTYAWIKANMPN
jgi:hypothetical protein